MHLSVKAADNDFHWKLNSKSKCQMFDKINLPPMHHHSDSNFIIPTVISQSLEILQTFLCNLSESIQSRCSPPPWPRSTCIVMDNVSYGIITKLPEGSQYQNVSAVVYANEYSLQYLTLIPVSLQLLYTFHVVITT